MHQSFFELTTTQTTMFKLVVLASFVALASASAIAPLGWAGHGWAGWAGHGLAAPLVAPHVAAPVAVAAPLALAAPVHGAYNYRGPLSLPPGQPANIVAPDGRPWDTLSVNLDRAAHYTARAVDAQAAHVLHKRSAVLAAAPVAWDHGARVVAPLAAAPVVGAWGHGAAWGHAAPWGHAAAWGGHW
ncbi:uncharacterized protein [Epargyreus clarus]|uniref:uncharacterized protein n=1 Tax=Epargyreus clarus TaxID=520877 RepID=UPI003C2ABBBB